MGHSNLEKKTLEHSYLEPKHTEAQLFREKNNTWAQLFSVKIVEKSCLEAKYTGAQLFSAKMYKSTAI